MTESLPPIQTRSAAVSGVQARERIISLVVVPYDEWTPIVDPDGKAVEECVAPGAFGTIQNRADRFLVNLEHDLNHRVGRCVKLIPDAPRGLLADVKIRRGAEGDQILDDAEDGMLGASIGMGVYPRDMTWLTRTRRRIVKAYLDHIALTWTPAYAGAGVLAVRSAPATVAVPPVPTPNLDAIRLASLREQYGIR